MNNNVVTLHNNKELTIWEDKTKLAEIRNAFAKGASDTEFAMLVGLGKATGLNPFLREIWLVKYGNSAAQIFIGRDGYRKGAQKQPDYDFHQADAVYENDSFKIVSGEVEHSYNLKNRGKLIGAYCIVKSHNSTRPVYVYVELKEYTTGKSLWATKPATMIKKVAEAQALRSAFQEVFAGSYDETEEFNVGTQTDKLKQRLATDAQTNNQIKDITPTDETTADPVTGEVRSPGCEKTESISQASPTEPATQDQLDVICTMIDEKNFTNERLDKAFAYFKVSGFVELTQKQAAEFIMLLDRV